MFEMMFTEWMSDLNNPSSTTLLIWKKTVLDCTNRNWVWPTVVDCLNK